ncbi:MAG: diaminopimelate epimerase [Holosporaceae bacterium]|nr:diaminopimelate epimerase [Holosporaceae bacterium]
MKFDKMQALGNDFVLINSDQYPEEFSKDFFINVCDRHCGIGCDLVVLYKLQNDEVFARFFNPDGSETEICGNAARCIGLLMKKRQGLSKCTLKTTKKVYPILIRNEKVCIEMGQPSFNLKDIGILQPDVDPLSILEKLELPRDLGIYHVSCVSIGNPHLILFCKNILAREKIISTGALLENHHLFKNKINVSFAYVKSKSEIILSVFERGAGLTLACGSGACASVATAYINGIIERENIFVKQRGGSLMISLDKNVNIFQTGPAVYVFSGEMEI